MTRKNLERFVFLTGLFLCLMVSTVVAVEPGEVSWTAQKVCLSRAVAAMHPDPKLRNPDYLAEKFVFIPYSMRKDYKAALRTMKIHASGSYFYVNARTHYIDALLMQMVEAGVKQVVILGAGFDSRGYRFRHVYPKLHFFEVDLPATIEWKKKKVIKIFGRLPEAVVYAPIDFNTQTLQDALYPLGYDPRQKTFFIWEGVTMYITEDACRGTLTFIKNNSAAGSTVVYDYILRPVIEGHYKGFYGAERIAATVATHGEPYICGWTDHEAEEMIQQTGLEMVSNVDTDFLTKRYLIGSDGRPDGMMGNFYRIMHARVP
jgi:methyltransferase (TIGR00027 family)